MAHDSYGEVIREMVELGFPEMRPDPADKRAKLVTYTPQGLAEARRGYANLMDPEARFAEEFGTHEYAVARDVLERLVPLLEKLEGEADEH